MLSTPEILDLLEAHYGRQQPSWPTEPYLYLVWLHSGYPASDDRCARGWESLKEKVGVRPNQILKASSIALASALSPGGMVPEIRASRLKAIAERVQNEFGGDLRTGLVGPLAEVRKILKKFPNIADPGADRILLFAGIAPVAAVPSNCPHVLVRIQRGQERENHSVNYKEAQQAIASEVPKKFDALARAYLLLKHHGQELCKRTKPKCEQCPIHTQCAFYAGKRRGRATR